MLAATRSLSALLALCASTLPAQELLPWQRLERIKQELTEVNLPDWAGDYRDAFGTHVLVAPRSGMCVMYPGCMGVIRSFAEVRADGLRIAIRFEDRGAAWEDWYCVPWGARRYLLSEQNIPLFCGEVNDDREPYGKLDGWPKMKTGDERWPVSGAPLLPKEWSQLLVDTPIETTILRVETHAVHPTRNHRHSTETRIELPIGSFDGVRENMCFFLGRWGQVTSFVERTEAHTCTLLATDSEEHSAQRLKAGERAGTRHKH